MDEKNDAIDVKPKHPQPCLNLKKGIATKKYVYDSVMTRDQWPGKESPVGSPRFKKSTAPVEDCAFRLEQGKVR